MTATLDQLQDCLTRLEQTNSNLDKVKVLKHFSHLKDLLGIILDPTQKTGLTRGGLLKYEQAKFPKFDQGTHQEYPTHIESVLKQLITKIRTGDDAKEMAVVTLRRYSTHRELVLRILEKDLKTRLGMALYRQAYQEANVDSDEEEDKEQPLKPETKAVNKEYSPALAHDFQKHSTFFEKSRGQKEVWYLSRKLDGVRCQVWTTPPVKTLSRTGRPFASLVGLQKLIAQYVPPGFVLDGEVCVIDEQGQESFKDAVSQVKRLAPMKRFCFFVLDVLTPLEFELKSSPLTLSQRRARAEPLLKSLLTATKDQLQRVVWIHHTPYSEEEFTRWRKQCDEGHWEGLMLRRDAPYVGKRTKDILKVKKFHTAEYFVHSLKVGPYRMIDSKTGLEKSIETVTAVEIKHKGALVSVGSGFTLEERQEMYRQPQKIVGRCIEVQYFEETQDKTGKPSLRFPTFRCWHEKSGRSV